MVCKQLLRNSNPQIVLPLVLVRRIDNSTVSVVWAKRVADAVAIATVMFPRSFSKVGNGTRAFEPLRLF